MDDSKLQKLQTIIGIIDDDKAKQDDVAEAFAALISVIKDLAREIGTELEGAKGEMREEGMRLMDNLRRVEEKAMAHMKQMSGAHGKEMAAMRSEMFRELKNAVENVKVLIPEETDLSGVNKEIEDLKESIKTVKDLIPQEADLSDLYDKLDKLEKRVQQTAPRGIVLGGARGVQLYTDGTKRGQAQMINLIPGTGVTLSYNYSHGRNDITINSTASGGSLSVLAATGTINDSNVDFTFPSEPTLVIVNGATYRTGKGCTISGTSVTLDNPVGTGGDIYGLG